MLHKTRDFTLKVRLNRSELDQFQKVCSQYGLSMSSVTRGLIVEFIQSYVKDNKSAEFDQL